MSNSPFDKGDPQKGEQGAAATEYGLLAGFVALALIVGVQIFGSTLSSYFGALARWVTDSF